MRQFLCQISSPILRILHSCPILLQDFLQDAAAAQNALPSLVGGCLKDEMSKLRSTL